VARRLTADADWPFWSRDGQSIRFRLHGQLWKMPAAGGEAVQITPEINGIDMPQESADGRFLYYSKGFPAPLSVWRVPLVGGEATKVIDSIVHPEGGWTVGPDGIYFFVKADGKGRSALSLYEFATGKTRKILTVERPISSRIAVSPDGLTILYAQVDEADSDLMLVENFR
jgi:Tol biopolymer transport system component